MSASSDPRHDGAGRTGPTGFSVSMPTISTSATVSFSSVPIDVGAEQVLEHADDEAADHRAQRVVDAAEQRARRSRRAGCRPSCWGRGRRSARPSCRRPRRSRRPGPSPAPASSRRGCRPAAPSRGFCAAARIARPSGVKRKKANSSASTHSVTPIDAELVRRDSTCWPTAESCGNGLGKGLDRVARRSSRPAS